MLKFVAVDCSPEARQKTDTLFALDRRLAYPGHGLDFRSALHPNLPSDYALLRIDSRHLK